MMDRPAHKMAQEDLLLWINSEAGIRAQLNNYKIIIGLLVQELGGSVKLSTKDLVESEFLLISTYDYDGYIFSVEPGITNERFP